MRCPKCGYLLEQDALFCTVCGTKVDRQIQQQQYNNRQNEQYYNQQRQQQYNWQNEQMYVEPEMPEEPKKSNKTLITVFVIVGIVLACLLLGIGGYIFVSSMLEDQNTEDTREDEDEDNNGRDDEADEADPDEDAAADEAVEPTPTPEVVEEVRPEDISISFVDYPADLQNYQKLNVMNYGCSSQIYQEDVVDYANSPDMVLDGNEISSWQEGVVGPGIGEYIWFEFPQERSVKYLSFKLGNWRDLNNWTGNNRPERLNITIGEYECSVVFTNEQKEFWVELSEPFPATEVRFEIADVHEGSQWDDTCIAEIGMYGE